MSNATPLQRRFRAATAKPDIAEAVACARTELRTLLLQGGIDLDDRLSYVGALTGIDHKQVAATQEAWDTYCQQMAAAFALGVAAGQLLHPDVFRVTGGAR
jgi:hypothetical protein